MTASRSPEPPGLSCWHRGASAVVTVDAAGARLGGAARFEDELDRYLDRSGRDDVRVIGSSRSIRPT